MTVDDLSTPSVLSSDLDAALTDHEELDRFREASGTRIHSDQLDRWAEVARSATDAPWVHGTTEEAGPDALQYMIDCYNRGDVAGRIALVHFPVATDSDVESSVVAITGNGPNSVANARHIAYASPHNVLLLISEVREARAEVAALRAERVEIENVGPEAVPEVGFAVMDVEAAADRKSGFVAACNRLNAAVAVAQDRAFRAGAVEPTRRLNEAFGALNEIADLLGVVPESPKIVSAVRALLSK